MAGFNPIASGILMGAISGAAMGFMVGGPAGAAVGAAAGGVMGAGAGSEKQKEGLNQRALMKDANQLAAQNQNALVESEYNKKKAARGLGDAISNPAQPMDGGVVTSSNDGTVNLLG